MSARSPRSSGGEGWSRARAIKLKRPTPIDDMRDAGRERTLVAGEIDGEQSDLLRSAEPTHRLPADEHLAPAGACRGGAVEHRWCLDGARANAIATNAPGDEIDSDRTGQSCDRGLGGAVDVTVG